jgi:multiple sugar transport system permease protein
MRHATTLGAARGPARIAAVCALAAVLSAAALAGPPPAAAPRELRVWVIWADRGRDAAFRKFEQEYPGWRVVCAYSSGSMGPGQQKLMTAVAGGDPPDVLVFDRFCVGEWVTRGTLRPQDDLVAASARLEATADEVVAGVRAGDPAAARSALARLRRQHAPFAESFLDQAAVALDRQLAAGGHEPGSRPGSGNGPSTGSGSDDTPDLPNPSATGGAAPDLLAAAAALRELCDGIHEAEFYPACWQEGSLNRVIYTVPMNTDSRALFYNEDLLIRAGYVDERGRARPPRDWDELQEYAVKLTERDAQGNIQVLGFAPNLGNSWLYLYGWQNGGAFMSADGRTCTLAEPAIVEALRYITGVYDALGGVEKVDVFQSRVYTTIGDPFIKGQLAMAINVDQWLNGISDYGPNLRFGVAIAPPPKGKPGITWSGGFSWAIPKGARHVEAAGEFIRFMSSQRVWLYQIEVNARFAESRGRAYVPIMSPIPAINDLVNTRFVANNPNLPRCVRETYPLFSDIMRVSLYRPATPVGQLLWDEHARATDKALRHTYAPQAALERGQAAVQRQLDATYREPRHTRVNWSVLVVGLALAGLAGVWLTQRRGLWVGLGRRLRRPESRAGYLFASPWLLGFTVFTAGPILVSLVYSFCRYNVLEPAVWVGLENYRRLLFHDPLFWKALANTAYMLLGLPLGMAAGLAIALLLNTRVRGLKLYRTIFYLPAIVPVVASSLLWLWVLNPTSGLINSLLRLTGVAHPPLWLHSASWLLGSKAAILLMGLWGAGGGMVIWLAGLKGIPAHLYEAAEMDGAGPVRCFWHITLPMLSPYIFFNLIMGVIGTMQIFSQAFIMTGGGPDDSTLFYAFYLFNHAFSYFNMGYASAMAWLLFVVVILLTVLQMWVSKRWVYYEHE